MSSASCYEKETAVASSCEGRRCGFYGWVMEYGIPFLGRGRAYPRR